MRYAWARYHESRHDLAYRIYVSECLRILTKNSAYLLALTPRKEGVEIPTEYVTAKFYEPNDSKPETPDGDTDDIIAEVLQSLGLG